jgi:DNA-binding protein
MHTKYREPDTGALTMIIQGNMIRIGKKPMLSYVVACVTLFNSGKSELMIRARGRSIPKAVDTVEMLKHSFFKGLFVKSVEIGSEDIRSYNGRGISISIIEIIIAKETNMETET